MVENLKLKIPNEQRHISIRLSQPNGAIRQLRQLIIIATGLHSHMDKESQLETAETYQQAGFTTLQFNFMGHGEGQNKSEGEIKDLTLSSSIKDMKTVWDYSTHIPNIDPENTAINANSYGALISLLALEKGLIEPESMTLVAPFSLDKFKRWVLPLRLLLKLMPNKISKVLNLPVSSTMLVDFLKNHTHGMTKKDLLGSTAVHFFVGAEDTISSKSDIKRWCETFNSHTPSHTPFIDGIQSHCTVYEGVPHFKIPPSVHNDIMVKSINFIRKTRDIRSR